MKYEVSRQPCRWTENENLRFAALTKKVHSVGGLSAPRPFWFNVKDKELEIATAFVLVFDDFLAIEYFYVELSHRRQSVGRSMVDAILQYAQSLPVSRVVLSTIGAHSSVDFWKSSGFHILETSKGKDADHDIHYLERRI